MRCTTCDAEVPSGAEFCIEWGARLPAVSSAGTRTVRMTAWAEAPAAAAPALESYAVQPYAPRPYSAVVARQTSAAAVVSLVFGILAWSALPLLGAIVAIVAGHRARREIRASGDRIGGRKLAALGLVLGYAQLVLPLLVLALVLLFTFALIR